MVAMTTVGSELRRGFRSSAVTPVGITIVVCAVIIRELLARDQMFFLFVVVLPNEMAFSCDGRVVIFMSELFD